MTSFITLSAKESVVVKSGDIALLKQKVNAVVVFDYSIAKIGDKGFIEFLKSTEKDFEKNWPNDCVKISQFYSVRFNKNNSTGMQIVEDAATAKYKMIITPTSVDMGDRGASFNPFASSKSGGAMVSGSVNIIDIATNKSVCLLQFEEIKGIKHVSNTARLGLSFYRLAELIAEIK